MRRLLCSLPCFLLFSSCNNGSDVAPDEYGPPQILFGDFHVHSTNSVDVMVLQTPLLGGKGKVTPREHCDFARFCSQLDFWAITDHQEGAPVGAWQESKDAVRECNALTGGDKKNPQMVTFAGYEWQQSSHHHHDNWGHKNVIFKGDTDDDLPARAIASSGQVTNVGVTEIDLVVSAATNLDPDNADLYEDVRQTFTDGFNTTACPEGVNTLELSSGCVEYAADPSTLYTKLDEGGYDVVVIPHGMTWGAHHNPLTSWEYQLNPVQHSPKYQTLLEIYSGHGSMEEYRTWLPVKEEGDGSLTCPEPSEGYLPCCHQAGDLAAANSEDCQNDPTSETCIQQIAEARQAFVDAGRKGFGTIPGAQPTDWLDCGECRDCFQAAEGHRPLGSAQAALARTHFGENNEPLQYEFGFLGATDTHAIGPGAGYKEDRWMSDIFGSAKPEYDSFVNLMVPQLFPDWVRQNSYYYSGGLMAVHAENRSRDAIWDAVQARKVYATTGERIELWFDLVNGPDGQKQSMGSVLDFNEIPSFEVKAVGSFVQNAGCPADIIIESKGFVANVCHGECYNPTTERNLISRVEIVKITPQVSTDEALEPLIQDPWKTISCEPSQEGCTVIFDDPDYVSDGRRSLYYAKVFQGSSLQLNGDNLRCEESDEDPCVSTEPCLGGHPGDGDDCKELNEEAAWASPIYLRPAQ